MTSIPSSRTMSALGPEWDVAWVEGPRARAKQLETLQIDIEFAMQWVATMSELVDRELDDQNFTIQKMAALSEWERLRKRAQKNLHYKYDPFRRKQQLVERDVKRQLAAARQVIEDRRRVLEALIAMKAVELPEPPKAPHSRRQSASSKAHVDHPGMAVLSESVLAMIRSDLDGLRIETATDQEILHAYSAAGIPPDAADYYLALINGNEGPSSGA